MHLQNEQHEKNRLFYEQILDIIHLSVLPFSDIAANSPLGAIARQRHTNMLL